MFGNEKLSIWQGFKLWRFCPAFIIDRIKIIAFVSVDLKKEGTIKKYLR